MSFIETSAVRQSARYVWKSLFRARNTHRDRSRLKNRAMPSYRERAHARAPFNSERDAGRGLGFRVVKPDRPPLSLSLSLSFLVPSFLLFLSPPALSPLPSIRSTRELSFAPRPINCFRIGESWERPMATASWIAIAGFRWGFIPALILIDN